MAINRKMGRPSPGPEALRYFVGPPLTDSFGTVNGMNDEDTQQAIRFFRERYAEKGIQEHEPYPGIPEMIQELYAAGKHLQIASSKPRPYILRILTDYGILDCFENVVGSEFDGRLTKKTAVLEELLWKNFQALGPARHTEEELAFARALTKSIELGGGAVRE